MTYKKVPLTFLMGWLVVAMVAVCVQAQSKPAKTDTKAAANTDRFEQTLTKLKTQVERIHLDNIPLTDVIEYFRSAYDLNIFIPSQQLEFQGYTAANAKIRSVHLQNVSVGKALRLVLDDVSGANLGTSASLDYIVDEEGVIIVSTRGHLHPKSPEAYAPPAVHQLGLQLDLIQRMKDTCFDPVSAGLIAIAGLKDDVSRQPDEIIADLEARLAETQPLPLRNAIRLTLKELYKTAGQEQKALENLRAMLSENSAAASSAEGSQPAREPSPPTRPSG